MVETNIRIVEHGPKLHFTTRLVGLTGQDITPDLKEKACRTFERKGLAAVPCLEDILVAGTKPIKPISISEDDWRVDIHDTGEKKLLRFANSDETPILAQLLERCFLIEIGRRTDLWTLDSPRIFYEPTPFKTADNVAAYRRYEISSISIETVGIGLEPVLKVILGKVICTETELGFFRNPERPTLFKHILSLYSANRVRLIGTWFSSPTFGRINGLRLAVDCQIQHLGTISCFLKQVLSCGC